MNGMFQCRNTVNNLCKILCIYTLIRIIRTPNDKQKCISDFYAYTNIHQTGFMEICQCLVTEVMVVVKTLSSSSYFSEPVELKFNHNIVMFIIIHNAYKYSWVFISVHFESIHMHSLGKPFFSFYKEQPLYSSLERKTQSFTQFFF